MVELVSAMEIRFDERVGRIVNKFPLVDREQRVNTRTGVVDGI